MKQVITTPADISGWCEFEGFYKYVFDALPAVCNIMEVGVWLGRSACYMGELIKNSNKNIKFYAVDTFKGLPGVLAYAPKLAETDGFIFNEFWQNVTDLGLEKIIHPVISESVGSINKIRDKVFSFIFIDADHSYESVRKDLNYFYPHLHESAIFAGHDYQLEGVKRAVDEFVLNNKLALGHSGYCWFTQKKS